MTQPGLARRLGTFEAVIIGLGSMLGAGVFAVFSPAARVAGAGLLIGLGLAALVAYCNATASAQLAAEYPTSGGTYIYGRERLGSWWGFLAGWGFVIGKIASCAAMALTFAAYVAPGAWQRPVAIAAVIILAMVNYHGVTRTAGLTKIIVAVVLATLALVVTASLSGANGMSSGQSWDFLAGGWYGILQSAGLLFFAFAGYARIATMGEEVRDPERTIPRAILTALTVTVLIYLAVAVSILVVLGPDGIAASPAPLAAAVDAAGWVWANLPVRLGAAAAALGALLALIAGVGRTTLAMARNDDLPRWLAAVHERHRVPHHAEITVAGLICVLILLTDLRGAIGFSSFGVLLYYLIANVAAHTQSSDRRRFPRMLQLIGVAGCGTLMLTLPLPAVLGGALVFAIGIIYRAIRVRIRRSQPS
ncbi:MAG TPA: amino acid permease [Propionibacteriaceae bacterium]|nr:amino acid permease [Propionibacteriaceae bacterium]